MAPFALCPDDPVVTELRRVFQANILRVPEERMQPLSLLASSRDGVAFLGQVDPLLADDGGRVVGEGDILESDMAAVGTRRTSAVDGELGAQILSGLLQGLGTGQAPAASARFSRAKALSFHFPDVRRSYVEIARLGKLLAGRSLDRANALYETAAAPKTTLRLVDSVIRSKGFEIVVQGEHEAELALDPGALQATVADGNVKVRLAGAGHLNFSSERWLTFAFTCVNMALAGDGSIRAIAPAGDRVGAPRLADADGDAAAEAHVLLTRSPQMLDLDTLAED